MPLAKAEPVVLSFPAGGPPVDDAAVARLRQAMTDGVGVVRDAAGLKSALRTLAEIEAKAEREALRNMTATATMIAAAALIRTESRGGHYRSDFPKTDPVQAKRSFLTLTEALEIRSRALEEE